MLNLIKYVNRMKKLLFFVVLALFMCSCEEKKSGIGEVYFISQKDLNITYTISTLDGTEVKKDKFQYSVILELPEGNYHVHLWARRWYPYDEYTHDMDFRIRSDETTTIYIPF